MTTVHIKQIKTPKKIQDSNSRITLSAVKKGKDNLNIVSHNSEIQLSFGNADKTIEDYLRGLINTTPTYSINYVEGLDLKDNKSLVNNLTQEKQWFGLNTSWVTLHEKTHLEFQFIKTRNTKNWAIGSIINNVMDQLESKSPRVIIEIPYHWIDENNLDSLGIKFITIMDTIFAQAGNKDKKENKIIVSANGRFTQGFYFMNNRGIHIPIRSNENKDMTNGYMDLEEHILTLEMLTYLTEMFATYLKNNIEDLQELYLAYGPQTNPTPPSENSETTHKTVFTQEHTELDIENPERNKKDVFYFKLNSHDWYLEYISQFEIEKTTNKKHKITTDDEVEIYTVTEYKFKGLHTEKKNFNYYSVTMPKDSTFKNVATLRGTKNKKK